MISVILSSLLIATVRTQGPWSGFRRKRGSGPSVHIRELKRRSGKNVTEKPKQHFSVGKLKMHGLNDHAF